MGNGTEHRPSGSDGLWEGYELGGVDLRHRFWEDDFCSLWLTDPLESGAADCCMRVVPVNRLCVKGATDRFCSELAFWQRLHTSYTVGLYHCGVEDECCFALMQYMVDGSVESQIDDWVQANLTEFAVEFARSLNALHANIGPHGNLKPTNVFPVRGVGVLLSDFLIPLWLDELAGGSDAMRRRRRHAYLSPEQQTNPRDYDTRSDVYSYGLILLRCLAGASPDPRTPPESIVWPPGLSYISQKCLEVDRRRRFADGHELLEALTEATESDRDLVSYMIRDSDPSVAPTDYEDPAVGLDEARACVSKGRLVEAVAILESLPSGTWGVDDVLDEIEKAERTAQRLAAEAVRLASVGQTDAALDAIAEAEKLSSGSASVLAVKRDLERAAQEAAERNTASASLPTPLKQALEKEMYDAARPLLEELVVRGKLNQVAREAIRQFKRGRVRKSFLDSVHLARRLYAAGDHIGARDRWLDAARWLPSGAEREKLRRIARMASKGRLRLVATGVSRLHGSGGPAQAALLRRPDRADDVLKRLPPVVVLAILVLVSIVTVAILMVALQ